MRVLAILGFVALIAGVVALLVQAARQKRWWVWGVVAVVGLAVVMIAGALLPPLPVGTSTSAPAGLTPSTGPTEGTPTPTPIFGGAKVYTDSSQRIDAAVHEAFVIGLESDPSTGYSWQPTYDTSLLRLEERVFQQTEGTGGLAGAEGTEFFRFRALHGAITEITLVYKRPWEQLSEGQTSRTFTVMMFTPAPTGR